MKWKKWFILSWILIVVVSVVYSISVRVSIPTIELSGDNIIDFPVYFEAIDEEDDRLYFQNKGISMADLYNASDIVVKVRVIGERKAEYEAILTKTKVLEVYKGETSLLNQDIYVYEYATIDIIDEKFSIMLNRSCNLMQEGKEYYLLLNFLQKPEGYDYDEISGKTYLLNNICYGKFSDQEYDAIDLNVELYDGITYREIRDLDVLYDDRNKTNDYYQKRMDFLALINKN